MSGSTKLGVREFLTVKLSLLGVNSFGVWFVSLISVGGGGEGEGGGGGLGVKERTVISGVLCPSELRTLSSSLRPKGSLEEWLASWGSGNLTDEIRHVGKFGYLDIFESRESQRNRSITDRNSCDENHLKLKGFLFVTISPPPGSGVRSNMI